jgi:hypothetical protein
MNVSTTNRREEGEDFARFPGGKLSIDSLNPAFLTRTMPFFAVFAFFRLGTLPDT